MGRRGQCRPRLPCRPRRPWRWGARGCHGGRIVHRRDRSARRAVRPLEGRREIEKPSSLRLWASAPSSARYSIRPRSRSPGRVRRSVRGNVPEGGRGTRFATQASRCGGLCSYAVRIPQGVCAAAGGNRGTTRERAPARARVRNVGATVREVGTAVGEGVGPWAATSDRRTGQRASLARRPRSRLGRPTSPRGRSVGRAPPQRARGRGERAGRVCAPRATSSRHHRRRAARPAGPAASRGGGRRPGRRATSRRRPPSTRRGTRGARPSRRRAPS